MKSEMNIKSLKPWQLEFHSIFLWYYGKHYSCYTYRPAYKWIPLLSEIQTDNWFPKMTRLQCDGCIDFCSFMETYHANFLSWFTCTTKRLLTLMLFSLLTDNSTSLRVKHTATHIHTAFCCSYLHTCACMVYTQELKTINMKDKELKQLSGKRILSCIHWKSGKYWSLLQSSIYAK